MSTDATLRVESTSSEDTFQVGVKFGGILEGGETMVLIGDLGAGKTTFIKGLALGLESLDEVASPSYTISREYSCRDGLTLHHFDFYRLSDPGIMKLEIEELINDGQSILAIEWSEGISDILPEDCRVVRISSTESDSERRIIEISTGRPTFKDGAL